MMDSPTQDDWNALFDKLREHRLQSAICDEQTWQGAIDAMAKMQRQNARLREVNAELVEACEKYGCANAYLREIKTQLVKACEIALDHIRRDEATHGGKCRAGKHLRFTLNYAKTKDQVIPRMTTGKFGNEYEQLGGKIMKEQPHE